MFRSIAFGSCLIIFLTCLPSTGATNTAPRAQEVKKEEASKPSTAVRRPLPKPTGGSRGFEKYAGRNASARLIAAAGTRGEPAEAKKYREEGEALYKTGKYHEAIEAFKHSLQSNPGQPVVHFNLGVIYTELQQYEEAINSYQEALRLKADYPLAHFNLGNVYLDEGEYGKAIESFRQAAQLDSIAPAAYYNMGVAYIELGQQDEALRSFKEAIRLQPEYPAAYYNLGIAQATAGQNKEAVEAFKQALRLRENKEDAQFSLDEVRFNLALALLKLNMKSEAAEQYRILKSLNSGLADELYRLLDK
jgi:tetratricopeptide (TPR) repeat protein